MNDPWLIVINNFVATDINTTYEFPVILRQLEKSYGHADDFDPHLERNMYDTRTLWVTKEKIPKLNGYFSITYPYDVRHLLKHDGLRCSILKYLFSLCKPTKTVVTALGKVILFK